MSFVSEKIRSIFGSDSTPKNNVVAETIKMPPQGSMTVDEVSRQTQVQQPNGTRPQNKPEMGYPTFTTLKNSKQLGTGKLPEYKVHVISQVKDFDGTPIRVSAYLPEQISVDISSVYKTPFDNSVLGDNLAGNVLRAFGNSGIVQEMTFKVWDTTQGLTFDLPLVIVADDEFSGDSAENSDIMTPILKLCRLCTPSKIRGTKFLRPPGPSLTFDEGFSGSFSNKINEVFTEDGIDIDRALGSLSNPLLTVAVPLAQGFIDTFESLRLENNTSVYLGNFLTLDSVVCEGVSQQYDVILDSKGKPLRATVNFRFSTTMVPTIEDLYTYYGKSANNVPSNAVGQ